MSRPNEPEDEKTPSTRRFPSSWQDSTGFPSDAYFEAVEGALADAGIEFESSWRDEPWDYVLELSRSAYENGPLHWATYEVSVVWRVDEDSDPNDLDGLGWYVVPNSTGEALGDYVIRPELSILADPGQVAQAIKRVITR